VSAKAECEARALSTAELEIVNATREPEIRQLSLEQLKSVGKRLKRAHDRAKDIGTRQQREMRGKADPRGLIDLDLLSPEQRSVWRHPGDFSRFNPGFSMAG